MSDDLNKRPPQEAKLIDAHGALLCWRIMKKMGGKLTAVFVIAGAFMLAGCPERSATATTQDRAYKRVIETKTLRVAYISYPPSFIKDANTGAYSGIMHEVLQEMAKRMDLKVDYAEETAWGTMIEAVNGGRVDLVCTGLWPNATRGKFVDFTAAVYFSPIKAYVKAGNTAFDGKLSAINSKGVKIATIDGEMTSIISKADFPEATADSHPQTTDIAQMLLEIGTGKADVTFVETAVAAGFLQKNPGTVEEVKNIAPVRVFPNVMMLSKDEGKLLSTLNTAMDEVANTGVVDRIVAKYETVPGLFMRRQLPYRSSP
jgi:polar amino acid transport system substrate-binding protein